MRGMLIPTDGRPTEVNIAQNEDGSTLRALQRLVGGNIEPFDVIFGDDVCVYVNEEGLYTCPPNRAVYATKEMETARYISQMDYSSVVKEGELYTILSGDLVAVGFDPETGEDRGLTDSEAARVSDYFTRVSVPGSGLEEAIAIQTGSRSKGSRDAHAGTPEERVDGPSLSAAAMESRAASSQLDEEGNRDASRHGPVR